jgi:hypothetical protein
MVESTTIYEGEYGFRHCVVASTWAFEAQGPGSIPGGGAISEAGITGGAISEAGITGGAISEAETKGGATDRLHL